MRVASSYVRTLSSRTARSGMTLGPLPAWMLPTVTTAGVVAASSRETTVCSRTTTDAAITTGSTDAWGAEPCAPRPCTVTRRLSAADRKDPERVPTYPAGYGSTCWARTTSGRGDLSVRPSSTMARAPAPFSSEGWKRATKVPRQSSRCPASNRAHPTREVTCTSWPQACITGCSRPSSSVTVAVEAYGRPVRSRTGRASMSARAMTTGPSPLARTPITPVPPTPSVTS